MVTNESQPAQRAPALTWLEESLREQRAINARLQQQLEQTQAQVWELAHRLHRVEEAAAGLGAELDAATGLQTQVASFGDRIIELEGHRTSVDARLAEVARQQHVEIEYLRGVVNEVVKRLESWERASQTWAPRLELYEEALRRNQEASSVVRQRVEDFERLVDQVDQRAARTADALKRWEQELMRLSLDLDVLHKQDAAVAERLQVYGEIFRRLEEEIALVGQQTDVRREFNEKLDLYRSAVRRTEERLNAVEAVEQQRDDRFEEHERALASIESRERVDRERLAELHEALAAFRTHVAEQFQKAQAVVERQRRRRIEEIEREIRELKVNGYRPLEE